MPAPLLRETLSRRTLLKGAGAALALPYLEAMIPSARAATSLDKPPLRAAFLFMPNGVYPKHWFPEGDDDTLTLLPHTESLVNVKDDVLMIENLYNEQSVGRNGHWPKVPTWLSGGFVVRTGGRDIDTGGTSLDQFAAKRIGGRTALPSLELGVDSAYTGVDNVGGGFARMYGSHIAWRDPHTPVPKEIIPQLAFDRLFRTGTMAPVTSGINPHTPEVAQSLQGDDTSVLDLVMEDAKSLQRKVGANDRMKIDEYLDSVRSVERRIEQTLKPQKRWINAGQFEVPRPGPGIPESHEEHVRLMLDIMLLAFWTDTTRLSTFMLGNAQTGRRFTFLDGVKGSFHGLSHHRNEDQDLGQYQKIVTWHVEQVAYVLEKMKSLDEAGTSLLENSMVLFGSTLHDGNSHQEENLPVLLAGHAQGQLKPGRRIKAPKDTPLCNLHLSLLQRLGLDVDQFGDSTGPLDGLS